MEYYKQGDAANADKIKAAFKEKGISDGGNSFIHGNYLYFSEGGEVDFCSIGGHIANIIKTHPDYQELELPTKSKFKVGDWIVKKDGNTFYGGNYAEQITLVEVDEKGKYIWLPSKTWVDADYIRLWTIEDAKDGDVLALNGKPFIYSSHKYGKNYCYINNCGQFRANFNLVLEGNCVCPATKEQRNLLFKKMQEAGYQWYAGKKELKKIIEPKFNVGNSIKTGSTIDTIAEVDYNTHSYYCESGRTISFENQDLWHLVPKSHYDISNFHEGMPVLVREYDTCVWQWVLYSHFNGVGLFFAAGKTWRQCVPFNVDTKHLLGTTDVPSDEYINWKT